MLLLDMRAILAKFITYAGLPLDILNRSDVQLAPKYYLSLCSGIDKATHKKEAALLFAKYINAESFDAPIVCSFMSPRLKYSITAS